MTIADELRMQGEIKGEIKGKIETYQELLNNGLIPRELAEQKIAELKKKLEEVSFQFQAEATAPKTCEVSQI